MKTPTKIILGLFAVLMIISLVGAGIFFYSSQKTTASTSSGDFVKPLWGRLECSPSDTYEGKEITSVPTSGTSIYCGDNENTDQCVIYATNIPSAWYSWGVKLKYKQCNNDGTNCDSSFTSVTIKDGVGEQEIKTIDSGKKLFLYYERTILGINVAGEITKEYKVWSLYRFYGGAKDIVRSGSCSVPGTSSVLSNILSDETYPNPLTKTGGSGSKWVNYVDDWAYGPGTNVYTHSSFGQVYCSGGKVYSIVKLYFKDGSYQKLDPTYSNKTKDGTTINGLGTLLGSVECCPNEPTCGSDFKYSSSSSATSCYSDIQCANGGNPIAKTSTSYTYWSCISSKCTQSAVISVECTSNSACASGEICDLSTTHYGHCTSPGTSTYCGDGTCQVDESYSTCPSDCDQECSWYQESYSEDVNDYGLFGWRYIFGNPIVHTETGCKTSGFVYAMIIAGTLIILGIIIVGGILLMRKKR